MQSNEPQKQQKPQKTSSPLIKLAQRMDKNPALMLAMQKAMEAAKKV